MPLTLRQTILATCVAALAASGVGAARACAFHDYTPDPTLIDAMLASEHIVLARADTTDPARFAVIDVLEGPWADIRLPGTPDIETRRALARDAEAAVLFARDGAYGPWRQLALLDPSHRAVVVGVVPHLPGWEMGPAADRFETFARLLSHPSGSVRTMALRELDRAPYGMLRQLDLAGQAARAVATARADAGALAPVALLLAGIAGGPEVSTWLADGLDAALAQGGGRLGAHATAYIEATPGEAVADILARLREGDLDAGQAESLVEALALHAAEGALPGPAAVGTALSDVVAARPGVAAAVARQFGQRGMLDFGDAVTSALRAEPPDNLADLMAMTHYVALARGETPKDGRGIK